MCDHASREVWRVPPWVAEEITKFSNRPESARAADETLSRLIAAKSPIVDEWLKKRDLQNASEDTIAHAWREYYARLFVLNRAPHAALVGKISTRAFSTSLKKKWTGLFESARGAALKTLDRFSIGEGAKKAIVARLKAVTLDWNGQNALEFLEWGIAYQPQAQKIQIGLRALAYPNDATLFAVFAHELAHSFDPCRWGAFFEGPFPFQKVAECLRSSRSVGALRRDNSQLEMFQKTGRISADLATALKANPTCNKGAYPPIGVQADQLPEAFADWFSAQVVRHSHRSTLDLRADLCAPDERQPGSSYPSNRERLEKIYFAPPEAECAG